MGPGRAQKLAHRDSTSLAATVQVARCHCAGIAGFQGAKRLNLRREGGGYAGGAGRLGGSRRWEARAGTGERGPQALREGGGECGAVCGCPRL